MFDSIKEFFKKFWGLFVAAGSIFLGVIMYKKKVEYYDGLLQDAQQSHDKQVKELQEIREKERSQYQENEQRYKDQMAALEKQYEDAKKVFDEKKKTEAAVIVKKYGNKPDLLAQKLSEVTGFKIVMPEE